VYFVAQALDLRAASHMTRGGIRIAELIARSVRTVMPSTSPAPGAKRLHG